MIHEDFLTMRCENCKHLGKLIPMDELYNGYNARRCGIHIGMATMCSARACYWYNKDVQPVKVGIHGTPENVQRVVLYKGKQYTRIAYCLAQVRGMWYNGIDVNLPNIGGSGLPSVHGKCFATEQEARENALSECENIATQCEDKKYLEIIKEARMASRQLTLF